MTSPQPQRAPARPSMFRSLRVRNYRLFAAAGLISVTGSWMQLVAQNWLLLRLTGSTAALGGLVALQALPTAVLGLLGGVIADRWPRRRILLGTQAAWIAVTGTLGVLVVTGVVEVWMLLVAGIVGGLIAAVESPTTTAFGTELVAPEDLANAAALGSATSSLGRVLGMAAAGTVVAVAGPGAAFVANALSFIPVVVALALIRTAEMQPRARAVRARGQIVSALRFVRARRDLTTIVALAFAVSLFGRNYQVTMAAMADGPLRSGAAGYGVASTAFAIGAVVGAVVTARLARPSAGILLLAAAAAGVLQVTAGLTTGPLQFAAVVVPVAAGAVMIDTLNGTLTQLAADPELRGRVAAVLALASVGGGALGGLLLGWLADVAGARTPFVAGGLAVLTAAALAAGPLLGERGPQPSDDRDAAPAGDRAAVWEVVSPARRRGPRATARSSALP